MKKLPKWLRIVAGVVIGLAILGALVGEESEGPATTEAAASADEAEETEDTHDAQEDDAAGDAQDAAPQLKSKVVDYDVINPATLRVWVRFRNPGEVAVTPSCTIRGSDSSGAYDGFDLFEIDELKPGENFIRYGDIVITNEGAAFVTEIEADCEPA